MDRRDVERYPEPCAERGEYAWLSSVRAADRLETCWFVAWKHQTQSSLAVSTCVEPGLVAGDDARLGLGSTPADESLIEALVKSSA